MVQALDFGKGRLEAVPLGFVLGATLGDGDGIFESGIVGPEGEFLEGGAAGEELVEEIISRYEGRGGGEGRDGTSRTQPT